MVQHRVLLVDDNELVSTSLSRILAVKGFEVEIEPSGDEALVRMQSEIDAFDVVISDVNMPGLDGIEFAFWVKQHHERTGVILMSGCPLDEELNEFSVLRKPFQHQELVAVINQTIDQSTVDESFS